MTERRSKFGPAPLDRTSKRCSICGVEKPLEEFGPDAHRADGRKRQCRPCQAEYARKWARSNASSVRRTQMKTKYDLTPEQYRALYVAQNGQCGICGAEIPDRLTETGDLRSQSEIDHDHATGAVRGLLCGRCNKVLARYGDSGEFFERVVSYLAKAQSLPRLAPSGTLSAV